MNQAVLIFAMNTSLLTNISVVLVDTKTPANIGSVARAMMNMGLSRLVLVRPPKDRREDAEKLAAGARPILDQAAVFPSLQQAIEDQALVIGASRHPGRLRKNISTPREMAAEAMSLLARNKVSVVFGNEVNGLDRDDLSLCHEFVTIPSSEAFPSLNLSHAVMIVLYELFIASTREIDFSPAVLAPSSELDQFYAHLDKTLNNIGFLGQTNPERIMFSLRQLFGRSRLEPRDISILRGILSAVDRVSGKR